jgi:putative intracellular protease/amidase
VRRYCPSCARSIAKASWWRRFVGTLLVASSGIVKNRPVTGFHLRDEYPELVVRPVVEQFGGVWREDQPVVVDDNLISSRHPDDMPHFTTAIREWLLARSNEGRKRA